MSKTADQIVEALGGTSAVAAAHDLTPSTVSSWRTANFIPRWWKAPLLKMADDNGVKLSDRDFPPKRPRRTADAQQVAA